MLPSSHFAPINVPSVECRCHGLVPEQVDELKIGGTARWQQGTKNESGMQARRAAILAGEFSEFISAATRLEDSYRKLQGEVSELSLELTERNAALNASLVEIERMRLALQQIVDSMPCGVLVLDRDGQISIINPESRRLLGLDEVHFGHGSKRSLRQISECSGINLEAAYESASGSEAEQEFCVRDSSGKRWIEVRNRRLSEGRAGSGTSDKTILILRDVTAQKRAEQEREAGRKAMALAEITTILAHEIRNPLASLELFAELIEQDGGNRGEWISNLRAGIRSLSGTVNNVLSFHGAGSLTLAPVILSAQIGNAIQFVRPIADQAGVSLEFVADHDQVDVMGNESALQQVFLNLLSNAIRHTPAGGKVTVSIRREESAVNGEDFAKDSGQIVVQFSDTGCGIRPDQIDRVFEPGFSGGGDTTGLGLAVCEQLMKKHGGRISVSNRINSGAIFTLYFPILQQEWATA
jgi:two-component system sensor histidine kinase FlrB